MSYAVTFKLSKPIDKLTFNSILAEVFVDSGYPEDIYNQILTAPDEYPQLDDSCSVFSVDVYAVEDVRTCLNIRGIEFVDDGYKPNEG